MSNPTPTPTEPENRFARQLDQLTKTERAIADGALRAAEATFAEFADAEGSHYYEAPGLDPRETWRAVTVEVARVTGIAAVEAVEGGVLSTADLHLIHAAIFRPVFGDRTLGIRRHQEDVTYGIVLGSYPDELLFRRQRGVRAGSLPRRLREISAGLRKAFEESDAADERGEGHRLLDAVLPATRAYAKFLRVHPYWDGNGRTAFPILNFALIRLGLLAVAVPESEEFHWCLGKAMLPTKADYMPLAGHLEKIIRASRLVGPDGRIP